MRIAITRARLAMLIGPTPSSVRVWRRVLVVRKDQLAKHAKIECVRTPSLEDFYC